MTIPEYADSATQNHFDARFEQFQRCIDHVKGEVRIETYAAELTELGFNGKSLRGKCPIHEGENSSSFAVYPDSQRWFCYRCDEGGDVISLCKAVEGHPQMWTAMISLVQGYDIELPERPQSWYRRQDEKAKLREQIIAPIRESYRRRFYRIYAPITLDGIEDEQEREREGERIWEEMLGPASYAAKKRLERRGNA